MQIPRPTVHRRLARLLLIAGALLAFGGCVTAPSPRREGYAGMERRMLDLVNEHRARRGLPRLVHDPIVAEIARGHSRQMAAGDVRFGHRGFHARARAIRIFRTSEWISENVAVNVFDRPESPAMAVKGLLGSGKHRRNIEGEYRYTGVGVVRAPNGAYYYTQMFVR
jgi:uncharacterized protein YkwD